MRISVMQTNSVCSSLLLLVFCTQAHRSGLLLYTDVSGGRSDDSKATRSTALNIRKKFPPARPIRSSSLQPRLISSANCSEIQPSFIVPCCPPYKIRITRNVFQTLRGRGDSVKVGANPNSLSASLAGDIFDVILCVC